MDYVFDKTDLLYSIFKLTYRVKRKIHNKLKDKDVTFEQWYVLYFIEGNEGCNQKRLAESTSKDRGAMTRTLNLLENKGLIERKDSYYDKREFLIYLTDEGKTLYKEISDLMYQNAQELKSIFTKKELEEFLYLSDKLAVNLE